MKLVQIYLQFYLKTFTFIILAKFEALTTDSWFISWIHRVKKKPFFCEFITSCADKKLKFYQNFKKIDKKLHFLI